MTYSRMQESNRHRSRQQWRPPCTGEMVEVAGGHIVRSAGRKDRHSKVYTAKGLRDRRVRLSAHTAIQFYDVQDRLGYDRPSKAVDWLIQNAKTAIDQLTELPGRHAPDDQCIAHEQPVQAASAGHNSIKQPFYGFNSSSSSFFPPPLNSEAIDDAVKPFASVTATASSPSSHAVTYREYTPDLLLNTGGRPQDLRLSLQSFHEPIFQDHHHHHHQSPDSTQPSFCSGTTNLAHGATSVTLPGDKERMGWWNAASTCDGGGGEFLYNVALPPQSAALHLVNSQFQLCTQREPLQSSNLLSHRAWTNPAALHASLASAAADVFASESYGGFAGFHTPARIENNDIANNLHSASPE